MPSGKTDFLAMTVRMFDDTDILAALRRGDERCVKMLFDRYYRPLCVYALKYLPAMEDVEDVVQNVFVSFWENRRGGVVFSGSLRSYLFGAVAKASLKYLRGNGRVVFDDIEEHVNQLLEEMDLCDEEEMVLLRRRLKREVDALPEKARQIFNAIVLENLTYKQVADRYSVSVNTVKTHYTHALKRLRDNLGDLFIVLLCSL